MAFNAVTESFLAEHLRGRMEPVGDDVSVSTAQVRDLGNLQIAGVTTWEAPAEVAESTTDTVESTVSLDDLTPAQQAQVQQFIKQVDTIPVEQLGMMKTMLEAQRGNVPPEEIAIFDFMLKMISEKIAEKS